MLILPPRPRSGAALWLASTLVALGDPNSSWRLPGLPVQISCHCLKRPGSVRGPIRERLLPRPATRPEQPSSDTTPPWSGILGSPGCPPKRSGKPESMTFALPACTREAQDGHRQCIHHRSRLNADSPEAREQSAFPSEQTSLYDSFDLCHPDLVFPIDEVPLRVLLGIAQLLEQTLEIIGMSALELEIGDEIVVGRLHGVPRMVELPVNPLDIFGADGGVANRVPLFLKISLAFILRVGPPAR